MCPTSPSNDGSRQAGQQQQQQQDAGASCPAQQNTGCQHQHDGTPGEPGAPSAQFQLIQKIRRKYNQEVAEGRSAEDEEAIRELVLTVAAEAKLLSTDLYTKPTHFVLELLQNADDCSYAPGLQPRVLLVVMPDAILHATNETGFTAAEVEAICAMARSTKSRRVGAFTGEKGIGFKATAVASELTYISSSGYTFAFDMRPGAFDVPWLGLVCPRWEQNLQERMLGWLGQRLAGTGVGCDILDGFTTRMWLQLKPDVDRQKLTQELCLLDPYMLLNLRKLKDVAVLLVQQGGVQLKHLRRLDVDAAHISIGVQQGPLHGPLHTTTRHLLCMRHVLQVPAEVAAGEEKRQGVDQVEVVCALPMHEDGSPSPDPHAQVYAFLPVRAYGFRFHMQVDLVLPAARESILESSPWNKWLQQELSATFVQQAMSALRTHHQQPPAAACSQQPALSSGALLQFLPLSGDVTDEFMGQVSSAIMQDLSRQPCVLTASGVLCMPADTLLPEPLLACSSTHSQEQQQQLISNEWLQQGLPGVQFVCDMLLSGPEADRTAQVLLQLGARRLSSQLLLSWLCAVGTAELLRAQPAEARAAWLQRLYSCCMRLRAQPAGASMHLGTDSTTRELLRQAPILQLYGSCECVSLQQLAEEGRQVFIWDSSLGDEADLQLICQLSAQQGDGRACSLLPTNGSAGGTSTSTSSGSGGGGGSASSAGRLCFLDPESLGPDGCAFVSTFLGVPKASLTVLVTEVLQLQAGGKLSDAQHDQLLLLLLRNAAWLTDKDLQLLQQQLLLRAAAGAAGHAGGAIASGRSSSGGGGGRVYLPVSQLHLPLQASSALSSIPREVLCDAALQQDLTAAGTAFVSQHYVDLGAQALQGSGRQGSSVWPLLRRFSVQELTLLGAVQQLLKLYSSSDSTASSGTLLQPVALPDHQRHLRFLAEAARDPACLSRIKHGLRLYTIRQDPTAAAPALPPGQLWWPMAATEGADALTDQLSLLCGVQLVHPGYVLAAALPGNALIKDVTTTLTPAEVWRQLVKLHSTQDLAAAAGRVGLSLQDLLLQQLTYLAGVRLQLPEQLASPRQRGSRPSSGSRSSPGLLLLSSEGELVPSSELFLPPQDAAVLELVQDSEVTASDQAADSRGMLLLHPCFEPFWCDPKSEQCLLLTTTLGVRQADTAAVVREIVRQHSSGQGSAGVTEAQRGRHLAYLAKHTAFLQQQRQWLQRVQDAVLLLDARGQHSRAKDLHLPLGPQFAELEADMCAAGMLFLHSSYAAASASVEGTPSTSSSTLHSRVAAQRLQDLLALLGVQEADTDSIMQHTLKLYAGSSDAASGPSREQHLTHVRFILQRWDDLSDGAKACVVADLPLLVADAAAVGAILGDSTSSAAAAGGAAGSSSGSMAAGGSNGSVAAGGSGSSSNSVTSSSSSSSLVYAKGTVYVVPAAADPQRPLLRALRLGGANFLHPLYPPMEVDGLLRRQKVQVLTNPQAAEFVLSAHASYSVSAWQKDFTPEQLAQHALAVARWGDDEALSSSKSKLLLAVEGTCAPGGSPAVTYRHVSGPPAVYFPACGAGQDWALQQVLLPGQVPYLHPAYAALLSGLQLLDPLGHSALRRFLFGHLGIQVRPFPGSGSLKEAIAREGSKRPLLLLLRDEWENYEARQQQSLKDRLRSMQVETTCGPRPLQQCFLPRRSINPSTVHLMAQLQLPCLELPDPDSPQWDFLQAVGVCMELQWPTLLKMLQQLSSSGARPPLESMQQLYGSISGLLLTMQVTADELRAAFRQQQLLFVPGSKAANGRWYSSDEVVWHADAPDKLFPHLVFIKQHYQDLETFFCNSLGVRNAELDDLQGSLLHFASKPAADCADKVRCIYELLAKHCRGSLGEAAAASAELPWLPGLLSTQPVLLVRQGRSLTFSSSSSSHSHSHSGVGSSSSGGAQGSRGGLIYLPDSAQLMQLFGEEIRTLDVPPDKLPVLQPLLACISPPLPSLSASVQRSFAATAAGGAARQQGRQLHAVWSQLLRQALPLFARYLYFKQSAVFMPLFERGWLQRLGSMPVFQLTGLAQTLQLGGLSRTIHTQAAAHMLTAVELAQWRQGDSLQPQQQGDGHHQQQQGGAGSSSSDMQPVLLVDAQACNNPTDLRHHIAQAYVDLLLLLAQQGSSSGDGTTTTITTSSSSNGSGAQISAGSAAAEEAFQRFRTMLKDLAKGDRVEVLSGFHHDGILALPPEFDPWAAEGPAAATGADAAAATAAAAAAAGDEDTGDSSEGEGSSEGEDSREGSSEESNRMLPQMQTVTPAPAEASAAAAAQPQPQSPAAAAPAAAEPWSPTTDRESRAVAEAAAAFFTPGPRPAGTAAAPAVDAAAAEGAAAQGDGASAAAAATAAAAAAPSWAAPCFPRWEPPAQPAADAPDGAFARLAELLQRNLDISDGESGADQAPAAPGAAAAAEAAAEAQQAAPAAGSTSSPFEFASAPAAGGAHAPTGRQAVTGRRRSSIGNSDRRRSGDLPGGSSTRRRSGDLPSPAGGSLASRGRTWDLPGGLRLREVSPEGAPPELLLSNHTSSQQQQQQGPHQGGQQRHQQQHGAQRQQQQQQGPQQQLEADRELIAADAADEPVPLGSESTWLQAAMAAAHAAAAGGGAGLAELCSVPQQPAGPSCWGPNRLPLAPPSSYIVELPPDQPAGSSAAAATAAAAAAAASAAVAGGGEGAAGHGGAGSAVAGEAEGADAAAHPQHSHPAGALAAEAAAAGGAGSSSAAAAAAGSSAGAAFTQPALAPAPALSDAMLARMGESVMRAWQWDGELIKTIGNVGEVHVFERFKLELPGFDASCWHTNSRHLLGLPPLPATTPEPAYDFLYTDCTGKLSGRPEGVPTRCFIEVKATRADLSSSRAGDPKPFEISRRQWELARALHASPGDGVFVIVRVERVGSPQGPRIAALLRDPVRLLRDGQLWVTSQEKLLMEGYPVTLHS